MVAASSLSVRVLIAVLALTSLISGSVRAELEFQFLRSFPLSMCPSGGLVQGDDGYFYGVTIEGGESNGGTLYRLGTDGSLDVVHHFEGIPYAPFENAGGTHPEGTLVKGDDGTLYGNTRNGGADGNGTLFAYQPATGLFSTIHHFTMTSGMGRWNLTKGPNGALYGTTSYGGDKGGGTIFRISKNGTFTTLHDFLEFSRTPDYHNAERFEPYSPISIWVGEDETIYGTTANGGPVETPGGTFLFTYGTAFRLDPSGEFTVLHEFTKELKSPGSLIRASDGNFYGVSAGGFPNTGAVLKFSPTGEVSAVKIFNSWLEGDSPWELIQGSDGALYGATGYGGQFSAGVVFRVSLDGEYQALFSFPQEFYGFPKTGLIEGTDGSLYGATSAPDLSRVPDVPEDEPELDDALLHVTSSATSSSRRAVAKEIQSSKRNGAFRIRVRPGTVNNRAPIVRSELITLRRAGTAKVPVLRNDKDPDRDALAVKAVTAPEGFSANFDAGSGKLVLSTAVAPSKTAVIGYTVSDGKDDSHGQVIVRPGFTGRYFWKGDSGARLEITVTAKGALTGKLKVNGESYKLRGSVGLDDTITGAINGSGQTSVTADLKVTGTPYQISGTLSIDGAAYEIEARRR